MKVVTTPTKYAGQWIAWNEDHTEVIAHGEILEEVRKKAEKKEKKFWLDKVPANNLFFGGSSLLQ